MAKFEVLNWNKDKVENVELNPEVFEAPVRKDVMHEVVKWQLACRRRGTHNTKTRAYVKGGGKKPFKQKGTGNARQGTIRSPLMPGGAIVFGPQPRDYSYVLPKKVKQLGLKSALSHLLKEGRLHIVQDMASDGKANELAKRLKKFGLEKAVLIDGNEDSKFKRACGNLPKFRYYSTSGLNVYDLLKFNCVVLAKTSLKAIEARCGVGGEHV